MPVKILAVEPGGPASHAGVRPGETLLSINGNEICDILDYTRRTGISRLFCATARAQNARCRFGKGNMNPSDWNLKRI